MQDKNDKTVVGIFGDYATAERVAQELTNAGIPRESIQVRSNFMTGAAGRTQTGEAHEGGISGFFHRLFTGDETDAGNYAESVRRGNAVVSVSGTPDQVDEAVDIMNSAGAIDIDRHVESYRQTGYEKYDPNAEPYSYDEATSERERFKGSNQGTAIPVIEEELQVGKRAVRRGGVRVYSHVVEQPVEENVTLREEKVRVERRPADRPVSTEDSARMKDQTIEVEEMAEEPVVQKRARVREEVVVGKETTERTEQIRDTVRRTQVDVQPLAESTTTTTGRGDDYRDNRSSRLMGTETVAGTGEYDDDFRRDWQDRYASTGDTYETYRPAYEYGYRSAGDPRYNGRSWSDVESDLRSDYTRSNPNSSWDRMKDAVRHGWEKVTGKR